MTTILILMSVISTEIRYPENIEHCERMFYLEESERTFYNQCSEELTLYYILTK